MPTAGRPIVKAHAQTSAMAPETASSPQTIRRCAGGRSRHRWPLSRSASRAPSQTPNAMRTAKMAMNATTSRAYPYDMNSSSEPSGSRK